MHLHRKYRSLFRLGPQPIFRHFRQYQGKDRYGYSNRSHHGKSQAVRGTPLYSRDARACLRFASERLNHPVLAA